MKAGEPAARLRAAEAARCLRDAGLEIESTLTGVPDPVAAVADELQARRYDEVVVSTLPAGVSRWLRLSLAQRARRMTKLPVTHVTASEARSQGVDPAALPAMSDREGRAPIIGRR